MNTKRPLSRQDFLLTKCGPGDINLSSRKGVLLSGDPGSLTFIGRIYVLHSGKQG